MHVYTTKMMMMIVVRHASIVPPYHLHSSPHNKLVSQNLISETLQLRPKLNRVSGWLPVKGPHWNSDQITGH